MSLFIWLPEVKEPKHLQTSRQNAAAASQALVKGPKINLECGQHSGS